MKRKKKYRRRTDVLRWLDKKGMSQIEWARRLGFDHPMTVFHWIHRYGTPMPAHVDRIREVTPDCPMLKSLGAGGKDGK